jgi:kinesin family protein 5
VYISSPEEVYQLMEIARNTRAIAATNMNERSSRSHLLFILTVSQNNTEEMSAKTGKLYLVDLAGS